MEKFNDKIEITNAVKTGDGKFETVWTMPRNPHTNDAVGALTRNGTYCPDIVKVEVNGPATIVDFQDKTRSVVICRAPDTYSLETGIVHAIVKRVVGVPDKNGLVQDKGCARWLQKLVDTAVDQVKQAEKNKRDEAARKAANKAKAEKIKNDAADRRAKAAVKQAKAMLDAFRELGVVLPVQTPSEPSAPTCSRHADTCACRASEADQPSGYARPDKKFKDFTQDERRAYWRWQKNKNKA